MVVNAADSWLPGVKKPWVTKCGESVPVSPVMRYVVRPRVPEAASPDSPVHQSSDSST